MNKVLLINRCNDCCFFDNVYYGYRETCVLLHRKIASANDNFTIPDDCPLPDKKNFDSREYEDVLTKTAVINIAQCFVYKDTIGDPSALTDEEVTNNRRFKHFISIIKEKF